MILPMGGAKELAELIRDFGKTLAPAWTPLVGLASDQLDALRSERRLRLAHKFRDKLKEIGIDTPTRDVAPSFLIPLLEHASLESDDDLQDLWATMLANAADGASKVEMRSAFIGMLAEMTNFDVTLLAILTRAAEAHPDARLFVTLKLPDAIGIGPLHSSTEADMREDVLISLANLSRLGCVHPAATWGGPSFTGVSLTVLGKSFVKACTIPVKDAGCSI